MVDPLPFQNTVRAVSRAQAAFLQIVGEVVGEGQADLYGALLLTSAHGTASMEASGHLSSHMWVTTPDQVVETLIEIVVDRWPAA